MTDPETNIPNATYDQPLASGPSNNRGATDTLILTGISTETILNPVELVNFLAQFHVEIELVSLSKFRRIILLCKNSEDSKFIMGLIINACKSKADQSASSSQIPTMFNEKITVSYSLTNNHWQQGTTSDEKVDYLELPLENESRRFLISPPLSPPPEWDHWHKTEEGPNKKTFHSPNELSHLLWERLGGLDSEEAIKYRSNDKVEANIRQDNGNENHSNEPVNFVKQPEVLFKNVDNGVPVILLDAAPGTENPGPRRKLTKTAMPPMDF